MRDDEFEFDDLVERIAGEVIGILGLGPREAAARRARKALKREGRQERVQLRQLARKNRLLDRLGLGIGGNPAILDTPGGAEIVRADDVAQGKMFPLGSVTLGDPGSTAGDVFTGALQVRAEEAFRPTRLVLIASIQGVCQVTGLDIGTRRQSANLEGMPVEVFGVTTTFAAIDFDIIKSGSLARVALAYTVATAGALLTVSGAYFGTEL